VFPVLVRSSSLFTHELDAEDFRLSGGVAADLDPMSNVSYRVYQLRIVPSSVFFRIATGVLIVLLTLAAGAAVIAARRAPPPSGLADEETLVS
jgi:hypothetical protein